MISFTQKGDFKKLTGYLERIKEVVRLGILDKYGVEGVNALSAATPVESGKTATSWYYRIERSRNSVKLEFLNSNVVNGVPIAIVLQYGHGTNNGGWVEGRDYINPAIQPIFDKIAARAWEEVVKV